MKAFILFYSLVIILIGLVVIIGVQRRWHCLLHPPDRIWIFPIWPYALMKGPRFNERFFATYHLIGGIVLTFVGLTLFIVALVRY